MTSRPQGHDFAIFVVSAELGCELRAVHRHAAYRTTVLAKNVRRFASMAEAATYMGRSVAPRPRRRYLVDTIPPLAECGRELPRPPALEQRELSI